MKIIFIFLVTLLIMIFLFFRLSGYDRLSILYPNNRKYFIDESEPNKNILLSSNESFEKISVHFNTRTTPKIIWQTYYDKKRIPSDVYDNIKKYAPGYTHIIIDDNEAIEFLSQYFNNKVVTTFKKLYRGAHKADFLRYALLYIHGGIYLDIKTLLLEDVNKTFPDNKCLYTFYSTFSNIIYQGIIVSPPKNPLFLSLINFIVDHKLLGRLFYHMYCYDFLTTIKKDFVYQNIKLGLNKGKYINYYLYEEKLLSSDECKDGVDRYGLCSWGIHPETKQKIVRIRRPDYPY